MQLQNKLCPRCGHETATAAQFCPQCGTHFVPVVPEPSPYMCDQCETPLVGGSRFCPNCGQAFDTPVPPASFQPEHGVHSQTLSESTHSQPGHTYFFATYSKQSSSEPAPENIREVGNGKSFSLGNMPATRGMVIAMGGLLIVLCCTIGFSLTRNGHSSAPIVNSTNTTLPENTDVSLQPANKELVHQSSTDVTQTKNDQDADNAVSSDNDASKSTVIADDKSSDSVVAIDDKDTMNAYAPAGSSLDDTPVDIATLENKLLSADDLADKSLRALSLSHSTIYALHGCSFTRPAINSYFESQPWYHPGPNFTEAMLSDIERANAQTIRAVERSHFGYGSHSFDEKGRFYQEARDPLKETAAPESGLTDQTLDMNTLQHRFVTEDELSGRSLSALSISYNAIYAAHGYVFKRSSLQQLFSRVRWYRPNPAFREQDLSEVEKANLKTIRGYERTHFGY